MTKDQIIAKPEPFGHLHDGNGNQPLTFERGPVPVDRSISCSTMEVFTFDQMKAYASLVAAQAAAEEREACAQIVYQNALACDPGSLLQIYLASNAAAIRERK
jgi:hypothetical protein